MRSVLTVLALFSLCVAQSALAENAVYVESVQVPPGKSNVTVGLFIENDDSLWSLAIPLVIRSLDSGAFIQNSLGIMASGRVLAFQNAGTWNLTRQYSMTGTYINEHHSCGDGPIWNTADSGADFSSPDAILYVAVRNSDSAILPPGSDGSPGTGTPSLNLTFDISSNPGSFEIDTTCIPQGQHLLFSTGEWGLDPVAPAFTKGVVEIIDSCFCRCHTDPNCDGFHDIVDYILIRDVVRGTHQPIPDSSLFCPVETTDVNCDGVTTIVDQSKMSGVIFLGDDPDSVFCDPCP